MGPQTGCGDVFCAEGKSLSSDHEMVFAVETFQKHEVLRQTSRDTLRGMMELAKKGTWCGGPVPYGSDAEIVDKLTQDPVRRMSTAHDGTRTPAIHHILDCDGTFVREVRSSTQDLFPLKSEAELTRLVPGDPERVANVRSIFEAMAHRKMGFKAIAGELNRRGCPSPGGTSLWRTNAVKALAENPVYRGVLEWNSRTEAKYNFIRNGTMVQKPRFAKGEVFVHESEIGFRWSFPNSPWSRPSFGTRPMPRGPSGPTCTIGKPSRPKRCRLSAARSTAEAAEADPEEAVSRPDPDLCPGKLRLLDLPALGGR